MPYRNVYEEKKSGRQTGSQEPEKNPRKIAQIYRSQLPTAAETADSIERLAKEQQRVKDAFTLNRGIRKGKKSGN